MPQYYTADYLRWVRNSIPIDVVITEILNMEVQPHTKMLRFRCPLCYGFHTATNSRTNLARCFDCEKNFNPIDMVIAVGNCDFVEAVEQLKDAIRL